MKKLYLFLFLSVFTLHYSQKNLTPPSDFYFYENKGQIIDQDGKLNPKVKYLFNSGGLNVQIKKEGFSYDVYEVEKTKKRKNHRKKENLISLDKKPQEEFDYKFKYHRVDIDFLNANKNPEIIAEGKSTDYENYYNIPGKPEGVTEVHRYQKVTYKNIYPNVDLVFFKPKDTAKSIEYNFIIHPKGKISDIKLKFKGAKTKIKDGKLSMNLRFGEMQENIPHSWIEDKAAKTNLSVQFKEIEDGVFGFEAPQDSFDKTVVIDPVPTRIWGTYYGGENIENAKDIENDNDNNLLIIGNTSSKTNIATSGSYIDIYNSFGYNNFLAKFSDNGKILWATYIKETNDIFPINCIKINSHNQAFIVGSEIASYSYFYIFNSNGTLNQKKKYVNAKFQYIEISNDDNYYLLGEASDKNLGTVGTFQQNNPGTDIPIIQKFDSNNNLLWGTYFSGATGGSLDLYGSFIDDNGNISILGQNPNKDMPLKNEFQATPTISWAGFYARFDSKNGQLIQSSYVGLGHHEFIYAGKIINNKLILVGRFDVGWNDFKEGIYNIDLNTNKITSSKFHQISHYFISSHNAIFDDLGNIFIAGETYSAFNTNIVTPNAYLSSGENKSFLLKLNSLGEIIWGTLYGGESSESEGFISIDKNKFIYLYGNTTSNSGISTPGTHQQNPTSFSRENFIVKFAECSSITNINSNSPVCPNTDIKLQASGGTSYSWTGPNGFISTDQNPIIPNANSASSGTYSCVISGTGDCDGTYTVEVKVEDKTPPTPDIVNLPDIIGDCHTVVSTIPTATDNCSGKIIATTTDALQYSIPGTYTITWKYDDGNGNTFTQTQKVIISSPALPTAVSPQTFCATLSPKISDIQISGQNIIWYDASGSVLNTATPLIDGTTYYASQTINGCESDKISIQVKVNATPLPTGNANQDFCTSRNAQIKDLAVTGTSLKYYDNLGNSLSLSTVLQDNTSYFVTQTLNNCESPKFEIKVTLTANSLPAQDYQLVFCNDTTANYKTEDLRKYQENIITGSSAYSFEYFDQNNNSISDFANRNLQIGINHFYVKVKSNDGCWKTVKLILQLNPKPLVNLPSEAEYCRGLFVELDAGSGYASYLWNTGATTQKISVNKEGTYTVKVTNSSNCENSSSTLVKQSVLATIIKVEIFNNNAKVLLSANGDFEFSLDNVHWQDSNEFKNLGNGNHTMYVKTKMGCIIGQMNFTIFNINNSFTPNGDGINDTWIIDGIENYPNSEIIVWDHYSIVVLKVKTSGSFQWNGYFNGRVLPTGTYWYIIKVSDGRVFQGSLLIKNRN